MTNLAPTNPRSVRQPPKVVVLANSKAAARFQRSQFRQYRHQIRDASADERRHLENIGVPAAQVHRLMRATGLSMTDLQRITGLHQEALLLHLSSGRNIAGCAGLKLFKVIELINDAEACQSQWEARGPTFDPERFIGQWFQACGH